MEIIMTGKAGVVDIVEVEILYGLGTQKDDQDGRVGTLAWTKLIVARAVVRMTNSATAEVMKACWTRRLYLRNRHYSLLFSNLCLLNSQEKATFLWLFMAFTLWSKMLIVMVLLFFQKIPSHRLLSEFHLYH